MYIAQQPHESRLQFGMVRRAPVYTRNLYRDLNDGLLKIIDGTCHLGFQVYESRSAHESHGRHYFASQNFNNLRNSRSTISLGQLLSVKSCSPH